MKRLIKTCLNKQAFNSKKEAYEELNYWVDTGELSCSRSLRPYKCPFCSKWHLGNRGI
jgi:hypothetical protein